jgi:hypothetical protein
MTTRQTTITTTANLIISYNPERTSLVIRVISGQPVYISQNPGSPSSDGYLLNLNDVLGYSVYDGDDPTLPLYMQTGSSTAVIAIIEQFGIKPNVPTPKTGP